MSKYLEMAFAIQDEIAEIRRDVHRHPEVGNTEERTSRLVRDKLAEYGVDTIESPTPTSVVATVRGNKGAGIREEIDQQSPGFLACGVRSGLRPHFSASSVIIMMGVLYHSRYPVHNMERKPVRHSLYFPTFLLTLLRLCAVIYTQQQHHIRAAAGRWPPFQGTPATYL